MATLTIEVEDGDDVDISFEDLSRLIGDQHILGEETYGEYAYLACIALETATDDSYEIEDTLAEYVRNACIEELDDSDIVILTEVLGA